MARCKVEYQDSFIIQTRSREFECVKQALEFIEMRASNPNLYNNFTLTVLEDSHETRLCKTC
jgi:hypothetical protein